MDHDVEGFKLLRVDASFVWVPLDLRRSGGGVAADESHDFVIVGRQRLY
jgi:hypothetical protein